MPDIPIEWGLQRGELRLDLRHCVAMLGAGHAHPTLLSTGQAAWYAKTEPTFADALAAVRRHLWAEMNAATPLSAASAANSPSTSKALLDLLVAAACYAA
jgi:hypothetical protein